MSLGEIGENQGSWEETGNAPMIILRYMGSGMYERCDLELGETLLITKKVKKTRIRIIEIGVLIRGSRKGT